MIGEIGVEGTGVDGAADAADARSAALMLMSEALSHLDSDSNIPAIIGAHLQTAIDALWTSAASGQHSSQLQ
jgi:hypothetical protein